MLMFLQNQRTRQIVAKEVNASDLIILEDRRVPLGRCQAEATNGVRNDGRCINTAKVKTWYKGTDYVLCGVHANCATNTHHFNK